MSFAVGWSYTNIGAVAPELARDYGVPLSSIGFLTMIVVVVYAPSQLPIGRAIDRLGSLRTGVLGLALLAAVNAAPLAARDYGLALGARAALGIATSLVYLSGLDVLRRRAGGSAQLVSSFGAVNGAAMGLALVVVPQLDPWLGWRGPFASGLVLAGAALAATLPAVAGDLRGREAGRSAGGAGRDAGPAQAPPVPPRPPFRELLRDRALLRFAVVNLSAAAFSPIVSAWVVSLLVEAGGYSTAKAGAVGSLAVLSIVVSRPLAGLLVHRRPQAARTWVAASAAMGVGGCGILVVAGPAWLSVIGCVLVGVASAVPWTVVYTWAPRLRPESGGSVLAIVAGLPLFVAVAGIPLVGVTFSLPGDGRIGFAAVAALWSLLLFVPPPAEGRARGGSGAGAGSAG